MAHDALSRIIAEQQRAGERVFPPATALACLTLTARALTDLGVTLPDAVHAFLQRSDGLDFNGLVLYGTGGTAEHRTPDLLAANVNWRATPALHDWLILGDTDTDLLGWHQATGACARLDRVGLQRTEEFPDVATMLKRVLTERL